MQTKSLHFALGAGLLTLGGCAGMHVVSDFSPATSFSQYHSFAMVTRPDSASHQLIDDRVRTAVDAQLSAKGFTEVGRGQADLFVGYGVVDHTHQEAYTVDNGWGGWGWGRGWGWRAYRWGVAWPMEMRTSFETYTDGTVVVCLVDAKTKRTVWQGQADNVLRLPVSDPADATRRIDEAVAKILAKYPPSSTT